MSPADELRARLNAQRVERQQREAAEREREEQLERELVMAVEAEAETKRLEEEKRLEDEKRRVEDEQRRTQEAEIERRLDIFRKAAEIEARASMDLAVQDWESDVKTLRERDAILREETKKSKEEGSGGTGTKTGKAKLVVHEKKKTCWPCKKIGRAEDCEFET